MGGRRADPAPRCPPLRPRPPVLARSSVPARPPPRAPELQLVQALEQAAGAIGHGRGAAEAALVGLGADPRLSHLRRAGGPRSPPSPRANRLLGFAARKPEVGGQGTQIRARGLGGRTPTARAASGAARRGGSAWRQARPRPEHAPGRGPRQPRPRPAPPRGGPAPKHSRGGARVSHALTQAGPRGPAPDHAPGRARASPALSPLRGPPPRGRGPLRSRGSRAPSRGENWSLDANRAEDKKPPCPAAYRGQGEPHRFHTHSHESICNDFSV